MTIVDKMLMHYRMDLLLQPSRIVATTSSSSLLPNPIPSYLPPYRQTAIVGNDRYMAHLSFP